MEEELYNIGVEREGLRCDKSGHLSKKPHPKAFGDRMKNEFISTDWGEAQLELRTPICKNTKECYEKLSEITNVTICELNKIEELLWPYSMQCILPKEEDFPWGNYGKYKKIHEYEMYLYKKYGYKMHCMSGIHLNFSFKPILFEKIKKEYNNIPQNINDAYLKIMRNFMKKAWILMYFFGATPVQLEEIDESKISLRNTEKVGFTSAKKLEVDLSCKEAYVKSIKKLIDNNIILEPTELYIPIRIKSKDKYNILEELEKEDIDHIEIRLCDINPFDKCGINKRQMDISILFIIKCLIEEENTEGYNYKQIAKEGFNEKQIEELIKELKSYKEINKKLKLNFKESIEDYIKDISNKDKNMAEKVLELVNEQGLLDSILNLAKKYSEETEFTKNNIVTHLGLKISTQKLIKYAILRGINYNIIDEQKSIVEFSSKEKRKFPFPA